jgi:hypothetical protein
VSLLVQPAPLLASAATALLLRSQCSPPPPPCAAAGAVQAVAARRCKIWHHGHKNFGTSPPRRASAAMAQVEFSFFRYERAFVAFLFFWVFWSFAPPLAPLPVADADGVLARFDDTTVVGGVPRPFFFGLATAPAHVEDEARAPAASRAVSRQRCRQCVL